MDTESVNGEIPQTTRMSAALEFLFQYPTDGKDFLNGIVTGDETCVAHVNVETKYQSISGVSNMRPASA
ncbi:hypothetical protein TNCV_4094951 [Trichonephila clavipes]|uniref:Uncharacterized protein n=1 Tax=Trichonephila clavipes TaxID=2585209 RepID=A0A8X6VIV9_TRICX|nr:hypothetical protein TNCV_4094951 [Trichonephila clavipes]